ncbi:SGNH/GDSL hydrolase family protein [Actinoplanes sp. NPDC051346]|uniref:SGNH/GDSL hydrolase family protein n=1 Tax=Actinoplanes sp. NPDC051346 TaxID=3155048 RepID=UPI00342BCC66
MHRRGLPLVVAAVLVPAATLAMVSVGRAQSPARPAARPGTPPASTAQGAPARSGRAAGGGGPVRVMALGDSITGSPGCWRALLWRGLPAHRVDFVGTRPGRRCGFAHDGHNEGHSGYLATEVAARELLPGWLSATEPEVVMMHLGTNDVWRNRPATTILAAFTTLVDQMRAADPEMRIIVAQILPMEPKDCAACGRRVVELNAALPGWAASRSTARSPISVVDQWTGFDTATDTSDGVHPNRTGDRKIARRWHPAVLAAVTGRQLARRDQSTASSPSSDQSS